MSAGEGSHGQAWGHGGMAPQRKQLKRGPSRHGEDQPAHRRAQGPPEEVKEAAGGTPSPSPQCASTGSRKDRGAEPPAPLMRARGAALGCIRASEGNQRPVHGGKKQKRPSGSRTHFAGHRLERVPPAYAYQVGVRLPHCWGHPGAPQPEDQEHSTPVPVLRPPLRPLGDPEPSRPIPHGWGTARGCGHTLRSPGHPAPGLRHRLPHAAPTHPHPQPVQLRLSRAKGRPGQRWSQTGRGSSWTKAVAATGVPRRAEAADGQREGQGGGGADRLQCPGRPRTALELPGATGTRSPPKQAPHQAASLSHRLLGPHAPGAGARLLSSSLRKPSVLALPGSCL